MTDDESLPEESLEDVVRRIRDETPTVLLLRQKPLVAQLNRSVKKAKTLQANSERIYAMLREMHKHSEQMKAFQLDGTEGLQDASDYSQKCRADMTTVMEAIRSARIVVLRLQRAWLSGKAYVRELPEVAKFTKTMQDDLAALALHEVYDRLQDLNGVIKICEENYSFLEKAEFHVDRWQRLHAQYARMTYFQRTGKDLLK